ncbi:NAD(+) diphosphatase [Clostridium thailandense]|uniref:NAD(+) diphosphatase n=1 Tax=Clostridium thailandense TaxID=2794346 RepID=UPI003988D498
MTKQFFIFKNNELLIKIENNLIFFPNESDINNLNINLINLDSFIIEDKNEFVLCEINELTNLPNKFKFYNFRSLISLLDKFTFNLAAKALHLASWNKTYKYCNKCGTLLNEKDDERAKICPECGFIIYPRISPAIITAVIKDKKLLLAHNTNFIDNMYSVIAGFVEPGETFEDCVAREVFEETSIRVKNIKYFGSQPWPFPDSLMVAFICEYESGELKVDGLEISDADWYDINKLPFIPKGGSIARKLIDWFVSNYKN